MAVKMNAMQKYATAEEAVEIPEGKVEQVCRQFLVHEDYGLAYKLQNEEINSHLNLNKQRNQIVRGDLLQAKHIQQTEQQVYQQLRKQKQAQLDEQLAKELQLNLIEEEQKQMIEQQRIADEDEKFAKQIAEKEKQRVQKRRLAREQAQIEKIKRDRLQYYLDNNLDVTSTMNDDLDELDLSDFCRKPPDQLSADQLAMFMNEQDEELAKFLTIYENQKKSTLVKDKQQLMENQDYEIARLIYEEEKAKVRRLKEKRLQKQRMKQQARNQELVNNQEQIDLNQETNSQPEYYIPDTKLYRLPNNNEQATVDEQYNSRLNETQSDYLNEEQSLYDEPPQEFLVNQPENMVNYSNQTNYDNFNDEETNLKQIDDRPNSTNSADSFSRNHRSREEQLRYNTFENQNDDNAHTYTLSTKTKTNRNSNTVSNFVNRALPPLPSSAQSQIKNVFCDIDPTYNSKLKRDQQNETPINDNLNASSISNDSLQSTNLTKNTGVHFAQLARVEDELNRIQNEYNLAEQACSSTYNQSDEIDQNQHHQNNGQNYALHNQQLNPNHMLIQGQKRMPVISNQKKNKKDKSKDKCRQQ